MGKFNDVLKLDATAQAELIRSKEVQPSELVNAAIEAIEALNPQLNAVITPMFETARKDAENPLSGGPFAGVPFLMKDIGAAVKGVPMAMGAALFKGFVPDADSELTSRLRKAGLIFVGKTNTPELGLLPTTEPVAFGPTKNPWDTKRTTGGSSGGSAAAVAAGLTAMAHANDGGGSIRIPASCCGVFGLKPTRARNPLGPNFGDVMSGMVCEHAVTRSVRDSAALLDATSGPDLGDPYWSPPKSRPFLEEVGMNPGRLNIAFSTAAMPGATVAPDCIRALQETATLCEELGHTVTEAVPAFSFPLDLMEKSFSVIWFSSCVATIDAVARIMGAPPDPSLYEPLTWAFYKEGKQYTGGDYLSAVTVLQRLHRDIARFMQDYDLILSPVLAEPPVPLGTFDASKNDPMDVWNRAAQFAPYTALCNATGQPAMSVPLFWNDDHLPIGSHFTARFGDEATLFRLAAQLEQARPWAHKRPPVSV